MSHMLFYFVHHAFPYDIDTIVMFETTIRIARWKILIIFDFFFQISYVTKHASTKLVLIEPVNVSLGTIVKSHSAISTIVDKHRMFLYRGL